MKAKRPSFPALVKRGSSTVKIYRDAKASGTYYRVVFHLGGKRHRLNFADFETAKLEAEAKAAQLARGDVDAAQLSGRDRLIYGRVLDALKTLSVAPDAAAAEYAEARGMLGEISIVEAARFYMRHHGRGICSKDVDPAVAEFIEAKRIKGVSELYLADLRYRLGVFRAHFHCEINAITADDVSAFLGGLKLSPRSFNNFLRTLKTFFGFAQDRRWLSKENDLLAGAEKRREKSVPVEILTPEELSRIMQKAPTKLAGCVALAAFAGVRSEEILRLKWSDIERRPGFVEIAAAQAKTAARRLVPITENLGHWLSISPRGNDQVWPHSKAWFFESMRIAANAAKVAWKANVLRHSFISYRLAETQDVNRVALEAGNSPKMIFQHYRELVVPKDAERWFAIVPITAGTVVSMNLEANRSDRIAHRA